LHQDADSPAGVFEDQLQMKRDSAEMWAFVVEQKNELSARKIKQVLEAIQPLPSAKSEYFKEAVSTFNRNLTMTHKGKDLRADEITSIFELYSALSLRMTLGAAHNLLSHFLLGSESVKSEAVLSVLYSLQKLRLKPDSAFIQQLVTLLTVDKHSQTSATEISTALWLVSRLNSRGDPSLPHTETGEDLVHKYLEKISSADYSDSSRVLLGAKNLDLRLPQTVLKSLLEHIVGHATECSCQSLSLAISSFGGIKHELTHENIRPLLELFLLKLSDASPRCVHRVIQGLAKMDYDLDKGTLNRLLDHLVASSEQEGVAHENTPRAIAFTVAAYGGMKQQTLPEEATEGLLNIFLTKLLEARPSHVSVLLHGLTKKDYKVQGAVLNKLIDHVLLHRHYCDIQTVSHLIWSLGTIESDGSGVSSEATADLLDVFLPMLPEARPFAVLRVLQGLASNSHDVDMGDRLEKILDHVLTHESEYDQKRLAAVIWAFSNIDSATVSNARMQDLLHSFLPKLGEAEPKTISSVLSGLAKRDFSMDEHTLNKIIEQILSDDSRFQAQSIAYVLLVAGRLREQIPTSVTQRLLDCFLSKLEGATPKDVSTVLDGMSKKGFDIEESDLNQLVDHLLSKVTDTDTRSLSTTLWVLGCMWHTVPVEKTQALLDAFLSKLDGKAKPISSAQTLNGLARKGFEIGEPALNQLVDHILSHASRCTTHEIANTVWALGVMEQKYGRSVSGDKTQALLDFFIEKLERATQKDVSQVCLGLEKMSFEIDQKMHQKLSERKKPE
jgi:hypothetical protein